MFNIISPLYRYSIAFILLANLASQTVLAQYISPQGYSRRNYTRARSLGISRRDGDSQSSTSREIVMEGHDDFCLFGPPEPFSYISSGNDVVSWCAKSGHGTRLIPDKTLHGVTFVKTEDYVQVSGYGDFTKINLAPGDPGGQFDSVKNTPDGANVTVGGTEVSSWVTLISATTFCMRACTGDSKYCPTDYEKMGCSFLTGNQIGNGDIWQDCESEPGDPPGVIDGTTYTEGQSPTPTPTAPSLSACTSGASVSNGQSPPPLYSWNGGSGGASASGSGATAASGHGGDSSTTWVPVTTCTPCAGGSTSQADSFVSATATPSADSLHPDALTQGVTQVSIAVQVQSTGPGDNLLDKRDGETTTSNGQCCFTTWTVSTIGSGSTATGSANASGTSTTAMTTASRAARSSGSSSNSGSLTTLATAGSGSVSSLHPFASGKTSTNGTKGTNSSSNSTGNDSSLGYRVDVVGVECVLAVLAGWSGLVILGGGVGSWVLF